MGNSTNKTGITKWLHLLFGVVLVVTFFLPWMVWDGSHVSGYAMVSGDFFKTSETTLGLENPFPKLSFTFFAFALIPVLAAVIVFLTTTNKRTGLLPFITGALSLSLMTLYILLTDFGTGNVLKAMTIGIWLQLIAAIGLILSASPNASLLKKVTWIIIGPVFVFASFKLIEKKIMAETHKDTINVKADYTLGADDLIKEFLSNDTATNKKYREKMLVVNGNVSTVDIRDDSTSNVKFADTSGYFINISLEKDQFDKVKNIKPGDPVSLKGVCSGSFFSEILGTTSIDFKRATLNKK
ncbi:MAG: hypothetical protein LH619_14360 [Chitinophagaceae bacterium]|nr:hypothetical protein [Chitinophagaceae bacterium]